MIENSYSGSVQVPSEESIIAALRSRKLERFESGLPVFDMSMINPDSEPPRILIDRLQEAISSPLVHRYSVAKGIRKLRSAFSVFYEKTFGVQQCPDSNICLTLGAKDALHILLQLQCTVGDTILVGAPVYASFRLSAELLGLHIATFNVCDAEEEMISEISSQIEKVKPQVLLLNFPHNPTGRMVSTGFYSEVLAILDNYNKAGGSCMLCNDFVYGNLTYDNVPASSVLSVPRPASVPVVEIYSLSKSFSIPGWRIAAVLGDSKVIDKVSKVKSIVDYGIFIPLQIAASYGLLSEEDISAPLCQRYAERADYLSKTLTDAGWSVDTPRAGCSVWGKVPADISDSVDVTALLLKEHGIAALSGSLFGDAYKRFVRFALVLPEEKLYAIKNEFILCQ